MRRIRLPAAPTRLAVSSDRSLIADAVAAALRRGDVVVARVTWPAPCQSSSRAGKGWPAEPPDLALMLCDLSPVSFEAAQCVVETHPGRWLLLTDAPRGPLWGAMLDIGVTRVMPSTTTMTQVLKMVEALHTDPDLLEQPDRDELVSAWRRILPERLLARARIASLTMREREVLALLHVGRTVQQIADAHGVAPSTVRSQVRSVLRKLGLNSQLAAVAFYDRWIDE